MIGVPLTHVPYKGTPPAMVDVSSGAVTFMFDQMTAALPLLQTGKLKLLAVTTKDRIALAPEVPTMQEAGVPGFQMASWQAVYAPKGTPKPILDKLAQEIALILKEPDVQEKLGKTMGMELVGSTPDQLRDLMATEIPRWAEVVKRSGATVE
jgi:tripartite-type tricarboxylate transporter receptor subunit TctC